VLSEDDTALEEFLESEGSVDSAFSSSDVSIRSSEESADEDKVGNKGDQNADLASPKSDRKEMNLDHKKK